MTLGFDVIIQGFVGGLLAIVGYFLNRTLQGLQSTLSEHKTKIDGLQQELMDLKCAMPVTYVLREDYIRTMADFGNKLDRLLAASNKSREANG